MIDLVVVDDNPIVRAAVRGFLAAASDVRIVGEASDGREALRLVTSLRPHVTLLDYRMPVADGLSVVGDLSAHTRILALTSDTDPGTVSGMLRGGAGGYLVWGQFRPDDLLDAVREVAAGGSWLSPTAASVAVTALRRHEPSPDDTRDRDLARRSALRRYGLSRREQEVLDLLGTGLTNAAIGRRLGLTEKTVKNHLNHVFAKLGVQNRTEAVLLWLNHDH
ncbi:response regulator transcription factor [Micromonospora sp. NBRC 110038]|uniref:LuxR C-terminal-related transcriptional regulator n=1 Tax=Micromonospora sp. NBRC 110038 TaxID=1550034 RepID=UPI001E564390|nr:response regulator transcription factor [Micromonospora sp. NBRC 110038]